jgi:hypothetical protein
MQYIRVLSNSLKPHSTSLEPTNVEGQTRFVRSGFFVMGQPLRELAEYVYDMYLFLLMCGDVERRPGPRRPKWPCGVCSKGVVQRDYSVLCNRCKCWVHFKCSSLVHTDNWDANYICPRCISIPPVDNGGPVVESIRIAQINVNGIGNSLVELTNFVLDHKIAVVAVQESKLTPSSTTPTIPNYSTVRVDRTTGGGGGLLLFINHSLKYHQFNPNIPNTDKFTEVAGVDIFVDKQKFTIFNVYIPPSSSCDNTFTPSIDFLLNSPNTLILGDLNAHSNDWYSSKTDTRGDKLAAEIAASSSGILNQNMSTRLQAGSATSPDVSIVSNNLLSCANWRTMITLNSDHVPIIIDLNLSKTFEYWAKKQTFVNLSKADWAAFECETESLFAETDLPRDAHSGEKTFRKVLLTASLHCIPMGRRKINRPHLPDEILADMDERDRLREADPSDPQIPIVSRSIDRAIATHKRELWHREMGEFSHAYQSQKLWKLLKVLNNKANPHSPNSSITFASSPSVPCTSNTVIANQFNKQFTSVVTHKSSRVARVVTRAVRRGKLQGNVKVTAESVTTALKAMSNSKAFGPDGLTIHHLKRLGPKGIHFLTVLINLSLSKSNIPAIWKQSIIIPLPKAGKPASQGSSYRPISLLCPAAKLIEKIIAPIIVTHLAPARHQHGFRSEHSTVSALIKIVSAIHRGFNEKAPFHRTILVCLDLSKAFDSVNIFKLIWKINNSTLPTDLKRWLNCYLKGRQCRTKFQGCDSNMKIVHSGVPQGAPISPLLFNYFLADCPMPTDDVRVVSYADDLSIFCTGPNIVELERKINNYLETLATFLDENLLTISAAKSSSTLFTNYNKEVNHVPNISFKGQPIPLDRCPKVLGVTWDSMCSFRNHSVNTASTARRKGNLLKALTGTDWGQTKETLLVTYKATVEPVINYAAPVYSPNLSASNISLLQRAQSAALRTATGCHMAAAQAHLNQETQTLPVGRKLDMLSAQYLSRCRGPGHPCHEDVNGPPRPRTIRHSLQSRHTHTVETALGEGADALCLDEPSHRKAILSSIHTLCVREAIEQQAVNRVLDRVPPVVHKSEQSLDHRTRRVLAQLRSGMCSLLASYQHRLHPNVSELCPECNLEPQTTNHLFACPAHPVNTTAIDLWERPVEAAFSIDYIINT